MRTTNKEWIEKSHGLALSKDKENGKYYIKKVYNVNYKNFQIIQHIVEGTEITLTKTNEVKINENFDVPSHVVAKLDDNKWLITTSIRFKKQVDEVERILAREKAIVLDPKKLDAMPKIYFDPENFGNKEPASELKTTDIIKEWRLLDHIAFAKIKLGNWNKLFKPFHWLPQNTIYFVREDELFYIERANVPFKLLEYAKPFDSNGCFKDYIHEGIPYEKKYVKDLTNKLYQNFNYCNKTNAWLSKGKPFYKLVTKNKENVYEVKDDNWINNLRDYKKEILAQGNCNETRKEDENDK